MRLEKYSVGIGDRFAQQGAAQLRAFTRLAEQGVDAVPVWNKSHREHTIIGTTPADVRNEADAAVRALGWKRGYYVDADHIGLKNVDLFVEASDFFTLDVADLIGQPADAADVKRFVARFADYAGELRVPGLARPLAASTTQIESIAARFLAAVREAGRIYRHIASVKGAENFVAEVSMDECRDAQSPTELLFILAALAGEGVAVQTIAPKFSGRFNKGVDYVGEAAKFAGEFEDDLAVVAFAVRAFGLPANLKLSVHSGSDKFSIYGAMAKAMRRRGAGLHLKTAGTTWLEELAGLALAGGEGQRIACEVYRGAFDRFDDLCKPYAAVIDIERDRLPPPDAVAKWDGETFAASLRHNATCAAYNPHLRQLLHVGYRVAAEMGSRYILALARYADVVGPEVTRNLYERHLKPLFAD